MGKQPLSDQHPDVIIESPSSEARTMFPVLAAVLLTSASMQPGPTGQIYTSNVDLRDPSKETGIVAIVYPSTIVEAGQVTPLTPIKFVSGTQIQQIHLFQVGALRGRPAQFIKDPTTGAILEVQIQ
jgi:hypothetical protein